MNTSCSEDLEIEVMQIILKRAVSRSSDDNNGNQIMEEKLGNSHWKALKCSSYRECVFPSAWLSQILGIFSELSCDIDQVGMSVRNYWN